MADPGIARDLFLFDRLSGLKRMAVVKARVAPPRFPLEPRNIRATSSTPISFHPVDATVPLGPRAFLHSPIAVRSKDYEMPLIVHKFIHPGFDSFNGKEQERKVRHD